jgi:hypothetical protein
MINTRIFRKSRIAARHSTAPLLAYCPYSRGLNSISASPTVKRLYFNRSTMNNTPARMIRPWKLLRIILFSVLSWFLLALLWAYIPSPSPELNNSNGTSYPTSVLLSGRTLTRVYL